MVTSKHPPQSGDDVQGTWQLFPCFSTILSSFFHLWNQDNHPFSTIIYQIYFRLRSKFFGALGCTISTILVSVIFFYQLNQWIARENPQNRFVFTSMGCPWGVFQMFPSMISRPPSVCGSCPRKQTRKPRSPSGASKSAKVARSSWKWTLMPSNT